VVFWDKRKALCLHSSTNRGFKILKKLFHFFPHLKDNYICKNQSRHFLFPNSFSHKCFLFLIISYKSNILTSFHASLFTLLLLQYCLLTSNHFYNYCYAYTHKHREREREREREKLAPRIWKVVLKVIEGIRRKRKWRVIIWIPPIRVFWTHHHLLHNWALQTPYVHLLLLLQQGLTREALNFQRDFE